MSRMKKTLEALFHRQIKKYRPLAHVLKEHERAEEGTEKRTYQFLMSAARKHLERKRLLHMRDAMSGNASGRARTPNQNPALPAVPRAY